MEFEHKLSNKQIIINENIITSLVNSNRLSIHFARKQQN